MIYYLDEELIYHRWTEHCKHCTVIDFGRFCDILKSQGAIIL